MQNNPDTSPGYYGQGPGSDTGSVVTEQVRQGAQQALDQTQQVAGQVASKATTQARSAVDTQKARVARSLSTMAQGLRQTGDNLEQQDQTGISRLPDMMADRIEGVSSYLSTNSTDQILADLEDFGRRNSMLFLSGAFALGLLAARFLKSSAPSSRRYSGTGYASGYAPTDSPSYRTGSGAYDYDTGSLSHRYEDVQGTPTVQRGYAPGLMGADFSTGTAGSGTDASLKAKSGQAAASDATAEFVPEDKLETGDGA